MSAKDKDPTQHVRDMQDLHAANLKAERALLSNPAIAEYVLNKAEADAKAKTKK